MNHATTTHVARSATKVPLKVSNAVLIAALTVGLAACSGVPRPTEQIAVSRVAIEQAQSAGAAELAPAEFSSARVKLEQANAALLRDDNLLARRLADEALADAQLAQSRTATARSQRSVTELEESVRVLREELTRTPAR